jgi:MFS transporter, DHA2 family, multidrug resistance protein
VFGFIIFAFAAYRLSGLSLGISAWTVFWPQILAGAAIGFLFVPMNIVAAEPLRRDQIGSATGTINLMRNVGGSIGISWVSTLIARRSQVHQTMLGEHLTAGNPLMQHAVMGIKGYLSKECASMGNGLAAALATLYRVQLQQAYLLAFRDVFQDLALTALVAVPFVFLIKRPKNRRAGH